MDSLVLEKLRDHIQQYVQQKVQGDSSDSFNKRIAYGTAGFRGLASQLEHLFYNVGLISGLRCLQSNANIGVMITASHNPIQDNGVKIIDANGEMLELEWEPLVEEFCNIRDTNQIIKQLEQLTDKFKIDTKKTATGKVMIAMDTRPSSEALSSTIKRALDAWSPLVQYIDIGLATTPALHYIVAESNKRGKEGTRLNDYYEQLILGFNAKARHGKSDLKCYQNTNLVIDCANGVGYETLRNFSSDSRFSDYLKVNLINTGEGILNKSCGADHVKSNQSPPTGASDTSKRYASLDGDADRVLYFFLEEESNEIKLRLLDGDKIMALCALYLKDVLKKANLDEKLTLGIVQTAYANGASTDYMREELNIKVDFVDTGVKNLHKQAIKYDFGLYFEANGHGTVWISTKAREMIENTNNAEVNELKLLLPIINNYTGDAISDILIVEVILRYFDWNISRWFSLYQDRPNSLIKIEIPDRNCLKTTNAGQSCTEPEGLQAAIDSIVGRYGRAARCFVRPSGTEDVVRIYAEADDINSAKRLALEVGDQVSLMCNNLS